MPNPTGLTRPQIGPGRASPGTVDVSAWSNPDQGTDGLRSHVQDPSRAHMAATIGIVDAGGYYLSDEVEGALQEIGGASSGGRQNGIVTGFGYSAVGLVVTFDTPSTALLPTLRTYSGQSATLPDNTPSVWVYIDPATGNISQLAAANPPTISGPENVLLWRFSTLAGAITSARDARLYVRNLDRKLPFTVRAAGPQVDQESEACFVTLDAALTYLTYAATLNGLRTEVVVRGPVNTGPIDLPVSADGLHIRGEDGGALVLTSGAYLIDTRGRDDVTFSDLLLQTDVVGATAIVDSVGTSQFLSATRCDILSGASPWQGGINLPNVTGRLTVTNSRVAVTNTGIVMSAPNGAVLDQVDVVAINFVGGSVGIRVGSPPVASERPSTVRSCTVTGFDTGIDASGVGHTIAANTVIPGTGAVSGITVGESADITVSGNLVDCSVNGGQRGIRTTGTAVAKVTGLKLTGNNVYGATVCGIQVSGFVQESSVTDNQVDCNVPSAPNDPTATAGIFVHAFGGVTDVPSYNTVSGNTVWRAKTGIYIQGLSTQVVTETVVSGNMVHHCAVGTAVPPAGPFQVSVGIGAEWCAGLNISSNNVYGIGRILTDAGPVVDPTPALVSSVGVYLIDCEGAAVSGNQVRDLFLKGASTSYGIWYNGSGLGAAFGSPGLRISDNTVWSVPTKAIWVGVGADAAAFARTLNGAVISGNTISLVGAGIEVSASGRGTVRDLHIDGNTIGTVTGGGGISLLALDPVGAVPPGTVNGAQITSNSVSNTLGAGGVGIGVNCGNTAFMSHVSVDRNSVSQTGSFGIEVSAGTLAPGAAGAALFEYVSVSGNDLVMSGAVGIQAIQWTCVTATPSNIRFSDNTISNTDTGIGFSVSGPLPPSNATVSDLQISRNIITATSQGINGVIFGFTNRLSVFENMVESTDVFTLGIQATAASANPSNGIQFVRNRFRSVPSGKNTSVGFTNQKVLDLKVEDNSFFGGTLAGGGGFALVVTGSSTGPTPAVQNLVVRRNSFRGMGCAGVYVDVNGPTDPVIDTDISDNNFEDVATDVALARASVILFGADASVRNLAVRGNRAAGFGHSNTTHGGIDLTVGSCQGIDVSGNQFNVGPVSASYGNIVSMDLSPSPGVIQDVFICRNMSRGVIVPAGATTPALIALDLRTASEVTNLIVCDNDLNRIDNGLGNTIGVRLWADAPVFRSSIDRNRVTGINVGSPAFSLSLDSGADGFSVCGNHVSGNDVSGADSSGISALFGQNSNAVRVSDNTVFGNTTPGYGIYVQTPISGVALNNSFIERNFVRDYDTNIGVTFASCINLTVVGNQTSAHTITGIEVFGTDSGGTVSSLIVDGNQVGTSTDTQSYFIHVQSTDSDELLDVSVSNNTARYTQVGPTPIAAGTAIEVMAGATGEVAIRNTQVCRNRIRSVTNGIRVYSADTRSVRIDDNDINNVNEGIQHKFNPPGVGTADVVDYSVSRNSIQARNNSTVTALIYLFHDTDTVSHTFHNCTIDDNNVNGNLSAGGSLAADCGIRIGKVTPPPFAFIVTANARSVSVSRNTLRSTKRGIDVFFGSSESVSMDGNKLTQVNTGLMFKSSVGSNIGDTVNVSMSLNSVSEWNVDNVVGYHAFEVYTGTDGSNNTRNLVLNGNNCHTAQPNSTGWSLQLLSNYINVLTFSNNCVSYYYSGVLLAGTTALDMQTGATGGRNFVFTGNVFRRSINGIQYAATGGPTYPSNCTFMGNIGDNSTVSKTWWQFENGGGAGWTSVLPPPGAGAGQFRTFNIDDGS